MKAGHRSISTGSSTFPNNGVMGRKTGLTTPVGARGAAEIRQALPRMEEERCRTP